jgi:hypothetical protein
MSRNSALPLFAPSIVLTGAVTAGHAVSYAGATCTAGQKMLGIAKMDGSSGDAIPVVAIGTAVAICGAAVSVGDDLQTDASGRVVDLTSGVFVGTAMGDTTVAGQQVEVFVAGNFPTVQGAFQPKEWLQMEIPTLVGTGVTWAVAPAAGVISKITASIDAALGTGNATLTAAINTIPVTTGVVTIVEATADAGDSFTCSPRAAKTVSAGDMISITVGGTNTVSTPAHVIVEITLS